jgi:hypothetical protein
MRDICTYTLPPFRQSPQPGCMWKAVTADAQPSSAQGNQRQPESGSDHHGVILQTVLCDYSTRCSTRPWKVALGCPVYAVSCTIASKLGQSLGKCRHWQTAVQDVEYGSVPIRGTYNICLEIYDSSMITYSTYDIYNIVDAAARSQLTYHVLYMLYVNPICGQPRTFLRCLPSRFRFRRRALSPKEKLRHAGPLPLATTTSC